MNLYNLHIDEYCTFTLEIIDEVPYLHCTVDKDSWNKTVYKHVLDIFAEMLVELKDIGIDYLFTMSPDASSAKFARMYGFKTLVVLPDGSALSYLRY